MAAPIRFRNLTSYDEASFYIYYLSFDILNLIFPVYSYFINAQNPAGKFRHIWHYLVKFLRHAHPQNGICIYHINTAQINIGAKQISANGLKPSRFPNLVYKGNCFPNIQI